MQFDVAIVGAGPVGLLSAALLGRSGVSVLLVERHHQPLRIPRAIRFDHEAMRVWQELGITEQLLRTVRPMSGYEWYGADGELILGFDLPLGPSGWWTSYHFFQPDVEDALLDAVAAQPSVTTRRGTACVGVRSFDSHVELELAPTSDGGTVIEGATETVEVGYLLGADGARSSIREQLGIGVDDGGFRERWLVIDVRPHDESGFAKIPASPRQVCDPARPYLVGPMGASHLRWEFMVLPGEDARIYDDPGAAWDLIQPWLSPDQGTMLRSAVYEFRSLTAQSMQSGRRAFLLGDAGHQMPPHMGEGLCSGIRDAKAIAWRLALVLSGGADARVLDSYSPERLAHVKEVSHQSVEMGKVSCQLDPELAAARDEQLRSGGDLKAWPFPPLGTGLGYVGPGSLPELRGLVFFQGRVGRDGSTGLYDDVVGGGFTLVVDAGRATLALTDDQRAAFAGVGGTVAVLGDDVEDTDGGLTTWMRECGAAAVLARPDHYVFGAVSDPNAVGELVGQLLDALGPAPH
ncbi:bifunctional 3-(3-hydroxy-phenyl)propionate/3-hydroxycinnamic acid hydroxylase [Aeromicrobium wangtongii]|uniref:bifunctional 3-(3-hydroxy-phenyl)propionate/3-hydroxycinnamic acid hydroxylase n=1 Tax=Aeromicrobium wangtongii TaxID=2969247 RepID=UPI002017EF6A|nr:bifunctional 3-(3-hydroxy-phenyl)propionate/3-hydroxycinnamic acid hydroxylase [Aeromicrobium wangtongii]MCL3819404.1 bifunctional 3-(3-hydroxy-phenyl)propionate/3-hydroxycinnamic acid hydroxylase [Aeromicrobium wangtongii]